MGSLDSPAPSGMEGQPSCPSAPARCWANVMGSHAPCFTGRFSGRERDGEDGGPGCQHHPIPTWMVLEAGSSSCVRNSEATPT